MSQAQGQLAARAAGRAPPPALSPALRFPVPQTLLLRHNPSSAPRSHCFSLPTYLRGLSHLWWTQRIRRGQTAKYNGRPPKSSGGRKGSHFVGQAGITRGRLRKSSGTLRGHVYDLGRAGLSECPCLRPVPPALRKPPGRDIVGNSNERVLKNLLLFQSVVRWSRVGSPLSRLNIF